MQTTTITIQGPHSDTSCTREVRHAYGAQGGCIEVRVTREDGAGDVVAVRWTINRGKGWRKPWKATFRGEGSEEKAHAFAAEKWTTLLSWLEQLTPELRGDGAAVAFSAQVASIAR